MDPVSCAVPSRETLTSELGTSHRGQRPLKYNELSVAMRVKLESLPQGPHWGRWAKLPMLVACTLAKL